MTIAASFDGKLTGVCVALAAAMATVPAAGAEAQSRPATAPATLKLDPRAVSIRTEGGPVAAAWNLWSNGRVGEQLRFQAAGKYRVVVRAYGSPARGVWPNMELLVDNMAQAKATVGSADPADYAFSVDVPAGSHEIAAAFTNDEVFGKEDRNLYLVAIEVQPPAGAAVPVVASPQEIAEMGAKQEEQFLAGLDVKIEANRKADATVRVVGPDGKPLAGAEVTAELARHDFLFGCNIYMLERFGKPQENEAYAQRFAELFNYATVGFYWQWYEPQEGKPNYPYTDRVVAWCRKNGIRMKGHPLLWGDQAGVPTWSNGQPAEAVQKQRVTDIITRYTGKIDFWEVVNEPSHCRQVAIDGPYRWARQADPNAYLIVNDYYVLADGGPAFFDLLTKAQAAGVPFQGIGIQAHEPRTMRFPLPKVWQVLDKYATLGKELHITEFTPCSAGQPITGSHVRGKWDEQAQADYAVKFYRTCFAHPAMRGLTWWDLCDNGAWLPGGGMLRADLTPKPVYLALRKLIHEDWKTVAHGKTDADGNFAFRGFAGAYDVTVKAPTGSAAARRYLAKATANQWTVKLPAN
jgi:GH35 family endo-1,4-beta-xylanase